jgi:hypothetical protein
VISALIMGSPVRRLISPITRCRVKPRNRYAGTDDGLGTGQRLDAKRLSLMTGRYPAVLDGGYRAEQGAVGLGQGEQR